MTSKRVLRAEVRTLASQVDGLLRQVREQSATIEQLLDANHELAATLPHPAACQSLGACVRMHARAHRAETLLAAHGVDSGWRAPDGSSVPGVTP